jgi:hypothetical protein
MSDETFVEKHFGKRPLTRPVGMHFPPQYQQAQFHCPFCAVYAHQVWEKAFYDAGHTYAGVDGLSVCFCVHCKGISVWYRDTMLFPSSSNAPFPHDDLPSDLKADYEEARTIVSTSPRGAAALLRLVIQKLMIHLGEKGENINTDIGNLVKKGLPVEVQQALDVVRVVGNEFVHGGEMNPSDTPEVANKLFELVNFVVEDRIAQPKKRQSLFASLPANKLKAIADRDKGTSPPP